MTSLWVLACYVDGSPSHPSGAVWDPHICAGPFGTHPHQLRSHQSCHGFLNQESLFWFLNTVVLSVPDRQTLVLAVVPKTTGGACARCISLCTDSPHGQVPGTQRFPWLSEIFEKLWGVCPHVSDLRVGSGLSSGCKIQ